MSDEHCAKLFTYRSSFALNILNLIDEITKHKKGQVICPKTWNQKCRGEIQVQIHLGFKAQVLVTTLPLHILYLLKVNPRSHGRDA